MATANDATHFALIWPVVWLAFVAALVGIAAVVVLVGVLPVAAVVAVVVSIGLVVRAVYRRASYDTPGETHYAQYYD